MMSQMNNDNSISSWIMYLYRDFWNHHGSPLVIGYPFMSGGPWPILILVSIYLYFVKVIGPRLMSTRKAYDLRWTMRIFNTGMVMLNLWGFWVMTKESNNGLDIWRCPNSGFTKSNQYHVFLGSIFLCSRLAEFADTVFFVLRKKNRQVSGLHVFHHSVVPIAFWSVYKFTPTMETGIYPYVNSIVHVIMYLYYTLSSFGPVMEPYLWWKKYLTGIQLVQFVIIILHSLRAAVIPGCKIGSSYFVLLSLIMGGVFFYMFYLFYRDNYTNRRPQIRHEQINNNTIICKCLHNGGCDCNKDDNGNVMYHHLRRASLEEVKRYQKIIYRNMT